VISRAPSYHGVSYGALTLTGLPLNQQGYGPLVPDVVQVPWDDLGAIDTILAERGDQLAAIIAEPVVGAGGVLPPPDGYLDGLRARCDRVGAFLIFDEVICGFGRLGTDFGQQRFGVTADMTTFAKGVTSGYQPLGGVIVGPTVRAALEADPAFVLRHGYTYSGHPGACAAAMANLDVMANEDLKGRVANIEARLGATLQQAVDGRTVDEARGCGGMWAVALHEGVDATATRDRMLDHGVICRPIGSSILAFCPPLVIEDHEIERCGEALVAAVLA
jgi:adenosylmethionine-8-amino-7-oxononanoate aminotransferase